MFKVKNVYMRTLVLSCITGIFLLGAATTVAETVNSPEWQLFGAATESADHPGTFILTSASPRQSGSIALASPLCAREYKINFDINLGGNIAPDGGDGIFVFFKDSNFTTQFRAHADTFFHSQEDPRYELDGNHISIESLGAFFDVYGQPPTTGNTTFGPLAAGKAPFTMEGSNWFAGEFHRADRKVKVTISNGTAGLLLTTHLPAGIPQELIPGFEGNAINGNNEQQVRNIHISILNNEGCADYVTPLTMDEARAAVENTCGAVSECPEETTYLECVAQSTQQMITDSLIQNSTADILMLEAQYGLTFCQGYSQCESDIDPESVYQEGFNAGFTSGESSGDATGYTRGFTEGKTTGYTDGYQAGTADGYAAGDADGYTRGQAAGYSSGYTIGKSDGNALGDAAGYTRGYGEGLAAGDAAGYTRGFADGSAAGYSTGFADGDTSGYTRGFSEGHTEGYNVGYTEGEASGYDAGYEAGLAEAPSCDEPTLSFDEALTVIQDACPCETAKNHGQRVACSVQAIKTLSFESKIDDILASELHKHTAVNRCEAKGKKG